MAFVCFSGKEAVYPNGYTAFSSCTQSEKSDNLFRLFLMRRFLNSLMSENDRDCEFIILREFEKLLKVIFFLTFKNRTDASDNNAAETESLRGKGNVSADGSQKGDLLLKVSVEESRDYSRKGQDLYTTVNVPFITAVLGGEAEVRMPGGRKILCKVPKGTDAGRKIRIRGKGIHPEKSSAQPGDLYVTVQVQVPKDLTDAEIRKLREFETLYNQRRSGRAHSA